MHRAVSKAYSAPAPVGGWNVRDPISDMDPADAVILDNLFPETWGVRLRKGYADHVTGFTNPVESLMPYHGVSTTKLFASGDSAVYDVTASGPRGAASISSLTNDRWQHINFSTSGTDKYLLIANGADSVRSYDGTSWATPGITGPTSANIIAINEFKRRIFYIEESSMSFWFGAIAAYSGTFTEFNLGPLATKGGKLMAMGTWTRDSGDGVDDLAVFLTSRGQAIVYAGTDPSGASTWALVGVFDVGAPVGRRCMTKVGSELILITEDGFIPISRALASARTSARAALSDKIQGAVAESLTAFKAQFGWDAVLYPAAQMVLFNVPQSTDQSAVHQYVANTTTGAWCRFKGWNASCLAVYDDELFFGGQTAVYKADTGTDDDGGNIEGDAKSAFSDLGAKRQQKRVTMVRPVIQTEGVIGMALAANMDFGDELPTSAPTYSGSAGSAWNTSPWNSSPWGAAPKTKREWQSVSGVGYTAALRVKISMQGLTFRWYGTDWLYEPGGYI